MKVSPVIIYRLFILFMLTVLFAPVKKTIVFPLNMSGIIFLLFGSYIAFKARKMFKVNNSPTSPFAKPLILLTGGIYTLTRNPMYLGVSIGLAGIAVLTGIIYNLVFPVLFLILMDVFFVRKEEKKLEKEFGEKYLTYKKQTRRWI